MHGFQCSGCSKCPARATTSLKIFTIIYCETLCLMFVFGCVRTRDSTIYSGRNNSPTRTTTTLKLYLLRNRGNLLIYFNCVKVVCFMCLCPRGPQVGLRSVIVAFPGHTHSFLYRRSYMTAHVYEFICFI